jgi:16S rRNA (cytosine967-C5)-methyltransferase
MPPSLGIIQNQRRILLRLIVEAERSLSPGKDFSTLLRSQLRKNKQFGSRDRRLYQELIYTWLRHREYIDPLRATSAETALDLLIALADNIPEIIPHKNSISPELVKSLSPENSWEQRKQVLESKAPAGHSIEERKLIPDWFGRNRQKIDEAVLLQRAPLWVRALENASDVFSGLAKEGFVVLPSAILPSAGKIYQSAKVDQSSAYQEGKIEIQDISSQILLEMIAPIVGEIWFDACAGAGGKALQLASLVGHSGAVWASDIRKEILSELKTRSDRAGYSNVHIAHSPEAEELFPESFDGVLVDAPCSASGTWRRRPYLRHQTTAETVLAYSKTQRDLLVKKASLVKPGGLLVYITCSLAVNENEETVAGFLRRTNEFMLELPRRCFGLTPVDDTLTIFPSDFDGDGFFMACFRRKD